uniref:Fibronectin type-III domain-containing protein n=1 Tax=Acrobeloides nanus TaxID=290746 RepID=A0A914D3V1_9BILA
MFSSPSSLLRLIIRTLPYQPSIILLPSKILLPPSPTHTFHRFLFAFECHLYALQCSILFRSAKYYTFLIESFNGTVPKNNVPDAWNQLTEEQVVVDPNMTSTYITESIAGPASARGTTYSYTYETHLDEPETQAVNFDEYTEYVNDENLERHSTQTQKITRMTKITTTRSIKQVPVDPNELYFDSEGNPIMNGYGVVSLENEENYGINLSREQRVEYEEVSLSSPSSSNTAQAPPPPAYVHYGVTPSAPGVPQLVDLDENEVALAWLRPDFDGSAGAILGYRGRLV